jgi:Regulator of ribonuclease activity B
MSFFNKIRQLRQRTSQVETEIPESYFYFYFPGDKKSKAKELANKLVADGYEVDIHRLEEDVSPGREWALAASKIISSNDIRSIHQLDGINSALAAEYGGDYDGHAVPVVQ